MGWNWYPSKGVIKMELIELKCVVCGTPIYVYEGYIKERMYCTLHCLNTSTALEKQQIA